MKQTVEQAAEDFYKDYYADELYPSDISDIKQDNSAAFIAGAEWQSKQSPWISTRTKLPELGEFVFVILKDRTIHTAYLDKCDILSENIWVEENEVGVAHFESVLAWMPIPSFDEILEANRDILERIKEKGD